MHRQRTGTSPWTGFSERLYALGYSTYDAYLASRRWQRKRELFQRQYPDARCYACGAPWQHLHHKDYRDLGREDPTRLVPVCEACHTEIHRIVEADDVPLRVAHSELLARFEFSNFTRDARMH